MLHAEKLTAALAFILLTSSAAIGATTYTYDALGRLSTATYDNGKQVIYSYDPAGNRTQVVTQTATNQPPDAVNDSISTPINTPKTFDPRTNDSDPESDPITITGVTQPASGTGTSSYTLTSVTYTPPSNYTGSTNFTYTISDGNGHTDTATISVTVTGSSNQPPDAVNDSISTPMNTPKTFDPLTNDTDPEDDTLTITAKTNGGHGSVVINGGTTLTYTPTTGYTGSDNFTYTISDGNGNTDTATVSVTVTSGGNQPPVAVDDSANIILITFGTCKTPTKNNYDPRTNDSDPDGDTLTITGKTDGSPGTVTINGGTSVTYNYGSCVLSLETTDTFTYTISDGNGGSDTATVTVNISVQPSDQLTGPPPEEEE